MSILSKTLRAAAGTALALALAPPGAWAQAASISLSEARVPVTDCGTIGQPGSYVLADDLPGPLGLNTDGGCLVIAADDVTLDLAGFSIIGDIFGGSGSGIFMDGRSSVTIRNGTLRGFLGGGVREANTDGTAENHRVSDLRAIGNGTGITLSGSSHQVTDCLASGNPGGDGIFVGDGAIVTGNTANGNFTNGIRTEVGFTSGGIVTGNTANNNGFSGIRINGGGATVTSNTVRDNGGSGIIAFGLNATVTGNTASNNGADGIIISGNSSVIGNTAFGNQANGIELFGSNLVDGNTAVANTVSNISGCPDCVFGLNHAPVIP